MQELLQMMQKITAEPNNNARLQTEPSSPPGSVTDLSSEANLIEDAGIADEMVSEDALEADSEPGSGLASEQAPIELNVTAASDVIQSETSIVVGPESNIDVSQAGDISQNEAIADNPETYVARKKSGFVKQWVSKAVSWFKRLIGY